MASSGDDDGVPIFLRFRHVPERPDPRKDLP
jgi:hypothetical protein